MQPEDPERTNPFDGEAQPLSTGILSPQEVLSLALERRASDGLPMYCWSPNCKGDRILAVDLTAAGLTIKTDFFDVLTEVGIETLVDIAQADTNDQFPVVQRSFGDLLPAAGTNFPEHQEETGSDSVFNLPKFGVATPLVTKVSNGVGEPLNYEVEICTRFDRNIECIEDFDTAQKGFFLCGDFSNRSVLRRLIDPVFPISGGKSFGQYGVHPLSLRRQTMAACRERYVRTRSNSDVGYCRRRNLYAAFHEANH